MEDSEFIYLKDETRNKIPNRPIDPKIIKDILKNGTDIVDEDENLDERPKLEIFAHKLYKIFEIIEQYVYAFCSICLACYIIYYTNFFYNLYFNDKIDRIYQFFSLIFFIMTISIFCYLSFYLPLKGKSDEEIDKEMDNIIPYCTIIGIFAIITLIISVWDIYYYYSIPIVLSILWAFIMTANFAPRGILGNIFFFGWIILLFIISKFIEGKGHTYYK